MPHQLLLVDDDIRVLQSLKLIFETKDFIVQTATSAREAGASLERQPFDIVITDMRMESETAGYDVIRRAKCQARKPTVIILSAYPIPPEEWRRAGADAMFMKGGSAARMLDEIERLALRSS